MSGGEDGQRAPSDGAGRQSLSPHREPERKEEADDREDTEAVPVADRSREAVATDRDELAETVREHACAERRDTGSDSSSVLGTERDHSADSANQQPKASAPAIIVRSRAPRARRGLLAMTNAARSHVENAAHAHAAGKKPPSFPATSATRRKPNSHVPSCSMLSRSRNDAECARDAARDDSISLSQ